MSLKSCEILPLLFCQDAISLCFETGDFFGPAGGLLLFLVLAPAIVFLLLFNLLLELLLLLAVLLPLYVSELFSAGYGVEVEFGDDLGAGVVSSCRELEVGA